MPEVTYHFNGHSASEWNDPDNFDDGNIATFANDLLNGHIHTFNSNNCPGTNLGPITKVELRVFGYGDGDDRIGLVPVFAGGDGDAHYTVPVVTPGGWTPYVEITNDTNHPDWSSWSHIQALGCKAEFSKAGKGNTMYGSKVEIRVTYSVAPTVTTQAVTDIQRTTATGHGTITDTGGENCSKRGVCWNTTGSPSVADDKSEETDSFGTGAFTRPMTGLTPGEHYYVKAYAYNSEGYGYGNEVEFDTVAPWEPPESDIDVGADPIDRPSSYGNGWTLVDKNNPANASGILHSVKIYTYTNITGLIVGTFYITNGNTLKCRDSTVIGNVEAGAERTFTELSITVQEGDYIGCYYPDGSIEREVGGFAGFWRVAGEYIDPNDEAEYTFIADDVISLYGYGDIEGEAKTSSDTGSGADVKVSGNPLVTLTKAETGSGADVLAQAEAILQGADSGAGTEVSGLLALLVKVDAGVGAELSALLGLIEDVDSGVGVESLIARLLAAVDSGVGVDAVVALITGEEFIPRRSAYDGYRCFMEQYVKNKLIGGPPWKLPDGTKW